MNKINPVARSGNDILSEEQVVELLGVKYNALRRWRNELGLPYMKIGRVIRYKRSDIDQWMSKFRRAVHS